MHELAPIYCNWKIKDVKSMIEIWKTDDLRNVYVFAPMAYCGCKISDINASL